MIAYMRKVGSLKRNTIFHEPKKSCSKIDRKNTNSYKKSENTIKTNRKTRVPVESEVTRGAREWSTSVKRRPRCRSVDKSRLVLEQVEMTVKLQF